jgi:hypothetical protein
MTQAYLGSQTLLQMGDGTSPENFNTIAEVTSIGALAQRKDLIEVTSLTSLAKEFIGGLAEGQEMTIVANWIPTDVSQLAVLAAAAGISSAKNFRYKMPAGGANKMFTFAALIMSSEVGATTPNAAVPFTFGLKISGPILGPL